MKAILIAVTAIALATSMASAGGKNKPGLGGSTSTTGPASPIGKQFR